MHSLLRGDHHVHSTFSDDAVSTLAENVTAASVAGLETLRLVDHVRSTTTWVPEYLSAVRSLRVPEGLTVLTGVEAKILDASGALDIPLLPAGIDRILIADHQFPGVEGPLSPSAVRERIAAGWGTEDALDQLVSALIAAMRRHPGNQLAHCFSLLPKIGLAEGDLGADRGEDRRVDVVVGRLAAALGGEAVEDQFESGVEVRPGREFGRPIRGAERLGGEHLRGAREVVGGDESAQRACVAVLVLRHRVARGATLLEFLSEQRGVAYVAAQQGEHPELLAPVVPGVGQSLEAPFEPGDLVRAGG